MDTRHPLTNRQQETLKYIAGYIDRHGYGPTHREIQTAFGLLSTNAVACRLKPLIKKGYLEHDRGTQRALRVVGAPGSKPAAEGMKVLLLEADRIIRIAEAHALKSGLALADPGPAVEPLEHPGNDLRLPHETREFAWTFSDPLPKPPSEQFAGGDGTARKLLEQIRAALDGSLAA